ncbi:MAG: aspartate kinase, partial [Armatimonadetes bacterium]|nr:aspartate kinase [Armatimonadota bacterium]
MIDWRRSGEIPCRAAVEAPAATLSSGTFIVISDQTVRPPHPPLEGNRQPARIVFEKERGVTSVTASGRYAYLTVHSEADRPRAAQELGIYGCLSAHGVSINLVKLHQGGLSFVVDEDAEQATREALAPLGYRITSTPSVSMVSVYAAGMRTLSGVMARIAGALLRAGVPMVQTGDGPDTVFCLVERALVETAVAALCAEFQVAATQRPIVVQKFGGKSVGTTDARRLAAERIKEAIEDGYRPVVVVSAIGRKGEPYATDTLLAHLDAVDPDTDPTPRERDMLMACGEIISTVIMAQTLKSIGLKAVALTGQQAG